MGRRVRRWFARPARTLSQLFKIATPGIVSMPACARRPQATKYKRSTSCIWSLQVRTEAVCVHIPRRMLASRWPHYSREAAANPCLRTDTNIFVCQRIHAAHKSDGHCLLIALAILGPSRHYPNVLPLRLLLASRCPFVRSSDEPVASQPRDLTSYNAQLFGHVASCCPGLQAASESGAPRLHCLPAGVLRRLQSRQSLVPTRCASL